MKISYKQIYVLCPYGLVTGGGDALHQLVYYINRVQPDLATLVYCDIKEEKKKVPDCYLPYVQEYKLLTEVPDEENVAVIVPETLWFHLKHYQKVSKYIWWLSVDKNIGQTSGNKIKEIFKKLFSLKTWKKVFSGYYSKDKIRDYQKNTPYDFQEEIERVNHLCASHYAFDFVSKKTKNPCHVFIEPISLFYLNQGPFSGGQRERRVLYNPVKSGEFVRELAKKDSSIPFTPLQGLNQKQLLELYRTSLLYVDFGPFPGAERMPKEACYNGCLIVTGKNGASAYQEDVSIPEEDKFDVKKENIPFILERIKEMLEKPSDFVNRDEAYLKRITDLESGFMKSISDIL